MTSKTKNNKKNSHNYTDNSIALEKKDVIDKINNQNNKKTNKSKDDEINLEINNSILIENENQKNKNIDTRKDLVIEEDISSNNHGDITKDLNKKNYLHWFKKNKNDKDIIKNLEKELNIEINKEINNLENDENINDETNQAKKIIEIDKELVKKEKKISKEEKKERKKENKEESRLIKKNNKPHKNAPILDPNSNDNSVIKLVNVSKSFTNNYTNYNILKNINLTIYEKEFVVIYGPSGSGKTTLLSIIAALDRPTSGESYILSENTIRMNESKLTQLRSKYIGYIYQQYGLLDILSVADNIKITANLQKDKSKKLDLDELLDYVGLLEHKNKKASQLSGGQSQRVAICRALIKNPKILFGDEPTGAIHIDATKQIMNLFLKINKEYGTTIVIVTHNQSMLALGDRVIQVDNGKIVENYLNKKRTPVEEINWEKD